RSLAQDKVVFTAANHGQYQCPYHFSAQGFFHRFRATRSRKLSAGLPARAASRCVLQPCHNSAPEHVAAKDALTGRLIGHEYGLIKGKINAWHNLIMHETQSPTLNLVIS